MKSIAFLTILQATLAAAHGYTMSAQLGATCWTTPDGPATLEFDAQISPMPTAEDGLSHVDVNFNKPINNITNKWNVGNSQFKGSTWSFDMLDDQPVVGGILSFNNIQCNNGQLSEPLTFNIVIDGNTQPTQPTNSPTDTPSSSTPSIAPCSV